jgi:uncharacterized membrane protein YbhN (UPF0104 family)
MSADQPGSKRHSKLRTWLHRVLPLLGLVLFVAAIWVLRHQLRQHGWHEIFSAFEDLPWSRIIVAVVCTLVGYLILTGYDFLAMRYINRSLAYWRVAMAAFIGYAFSNSIGHSFLTGGTVRLRLYSVWGLTGLEIAKIVLFTHVTFYLGMLLLIGGACIFEPRVIERESARVGVGLPEPLVIAIGALMLAVVAGYFVWSIWQRTDIRIRSWRFPVPSVGLSLAQLVIGSLDMALVAGVLWALLPPITSMSFAGFVGLFMIAQVIGVGSQVPGGLGVFETIMVHILSDEVDPATVLGVLLAYRVIYFVVPMIIAAIILGLYEIRTHQHLLRQMRKAKLPDDLP